MGFTQHVMQPTHNRGHTLDLVISHGLSTSVSSVDLAVSDHYFVFFNITGFMQQETSVRTVRTHYLTPEVAANFIKVLCRSPPVVLPASCDFIVENFNNKLKSSLDSVAPLITKKVKTKPTPLWRNKKIRKLKRKCRMAERKWRKNKLTINHQLFHEQLKIYNSAVKQARNKYFASIISNHKNNPKVHFSTVDPLIIPDFNKCKAQQLTLYVKNLQITSGAILILLDPAFYLTRKLFLIKGLLSPEETLDSFVLVDAKMLGRVLSQVNPATCLLDSIPTSLVNTFYGSFESELLNIVNCSPQTGIFPAAFKIAVVRPLLKKSSLNPDIFNNYRPVSYLPFLSKILEELVFIQLNDCNILGKNQSGFRMYHSTETALLKIVSDLRCNLDSHKISVLVLLDLSAAFCTVEHPILLNRLRHLFGLSGTVFKWFSSYLTEDF